MASHSLHGWISCAAIAAAYVGGTGVAIAVGDFRDRHEVVHR